jgi:transcriptional antiterminator RfaH
MGDIASAGTAEAPLLSIRIARVSATFWSVVLTRPKAEAMALRHLERQKFEVFFPYYLTKTKRGRDLVKALFPSYLFVRLYEDTHWSPINSTHGVRRLLCYDSVGSPYREPHRIGEGFVDNLRAMRLSPGQPEAGAEPAKRDEIPAGTLCIVRRGAFATRTGIVEMSSASRIALLMEVFGGKEVRVTFSRDDVEILESARIDIE